MVEQEAFKNNMEWTDFYQRQIDVSEVPLYPCKKLTEPHVPQ